MKFRVTMKDPDTLHDAIRDAVKNDLSQLTQLDQKERNLLADAREEKIQELCTQWFEYSEYLTVEIDTELKTCTVVPRK